MSINLLLYVRSRFVGYTHGGKQKRTQVGIGVKIKPKVTPTAVGKNLCVTFIVGWVVCSRRTYERLICVTQHISCYLECRILPTCRDLTYNFCRECLTYIPHCGAGRRGIKVVTSAIGVWNHCGDQILLWQKRRGKVRKDYHYLDRK